MIFEPEMQEMSVILSWIFGGANRISMPVFDFTLSGLVLADAFPRWAIPIVNVYVPFGERELIIIVDNL
jgi:hypothetical protein